MTLARWTPLTLAKNRPGQRTVEWLELFYDLIYVAALIQLGEILISDLSWGGVARFAALFALLWWVWTGVTFLKNRLDVDDLWHRILIFGQMFAIGSAAVAVGGAFGAQSTQFAVSFFFVLLTLVLMYARVWLQLPGTRSITTLLLAIYTSAAVLWLVSIALPSPARYWLWALAFVLSVSWLFFPKLQHRLADVFPVNQEHMKERFALFTIIVLGESFIKMTGSVADHGATADSYLHGAFAFLIAIGLWWTYFDDVADSPIDARPGRFPSTAKWTTLHLPMTMGLTAVGVGLEGLVLSEVGASVDLSGGWLLVGSVAVVLLAVAGLDLLTTNRHFGVTRKDRLTPRLGAVVLLILVGLAISSLSVTALGALVAAIVVGQMAWQVAVAMRAEHAVRVDTANLIQTHDPAAGCEHLAHLLPTEPATAGCLECIEADMVWVHLRYCTLCGQVGCCDDSDGRHAAAHHLRTDHETIRSMEPGEAWAWCYVDDVGVATAATTD